ncbi:hypothetical protein HMPREF9695_04487 [Afipia broomeae ATCC 49717]|uniref:Uncharacterized protein n=1 Tax=Afipia broomeae ATCC 49717 TaxID=883078 RepID=K8NW57_9BRAD|nr:hypothetical protein HMPREF9695_04487 [Afipia broomeae ATCC 49717]
MPKVPASVLIPAHAIRIPTRRHDGATVSACSKSPPSEPHPFFFSFGFRMVKRALPRPVPMVRIPQRL